MMTFISSPSPNPVTPTVVPLNDLTVVASHEATLRANKLDSLEALFVNARGESLVKPGLAAWRERIRLDLTEEGRRRIFYLKRFSNPPRSARRETRRSGSGAQSVAGMEWAWMNCLARDGIAGVRPVAYGQELESGRERRSAILAESVPGKSLESWMDEWSEVDRPTIHRLSAPVAALIAGLHRRGYLHRDLYLAHIFYDPAAPVQNSIRLIDLQRVRRPTSRFRRWIVKDLAALNYSAPTRLVSPTDRLRWLKQYLGMPKLDASAKRLAYRVIGKTLAIARHDRRRVVRLSAPTDLNGGTV